MAQHDYVIDNSTGANVRADINSVLQAIASNNSGSSAPSTTFALQSFANTTDSMLQLRNAANNAFVNLRKFDGSLPLPDGSASSPSLFFDDDTNTGVFSSAADTLNFTTGGVERLELGATTIFNESGADVDFRIEGDTDQNLFYVDAGNNRIGIGTSSPTKALTVGTTTPSILLADGSGRNVELIGGSTSTNPGLRTKYAEALNFGTNSLERMRIDSSGHFLFNCTSLPSSSVAGMAFEKNGNTGVIFHSNGSATTSINVGEFINGNGVVGRITTNGSNCSFTDVSDYRLKENEVAISDGITRLKQLKPYRFNYKSDATKTFDGFFAHEAQTVVPESVVGEKDATKEDGSIDPQCIDQSKLVPLLVAAVKELIGKVEALEAA